ncbi:MAG: hypothetical protein CM1200mP20_03110 [Pseudomonadota bacterium]|nr:MAG: hypothetical protein CM1200mP20_03110 [Pseudomonadota bacterium]
MGLPAVQATRADLGAALSQTVNTIQCPVHCACKFIPALGSQLVDGVTAALEEFQSCGGDLAFGKLPAL